MLALAFGRPDVRERFPDLWSERGVQEIRLGPLLPRAARSLVQTLLPEAPEPVVERIGERAAGNAFALEELIRAEDEGRGGELPETVLGLVEARLARLEPEARRVLRAASVFGETFWAGGVRALLGDRAAVIDAGEWLEILVERELLTARESAAIPGERASRFRHALVREAAYSMLTEEDRALGHRLAAEWLEQAGEVDPFVLASHHDKGGERERAAEHYLAAARHALEGDDLEGALDRVERGIACGVEGTLRGELRMVECDAHRWRGLHDRAARVGTEALAELRPGSAEWFTCAGVVALTRACIADRAGHAEIARMLLEAEPEPGAEAAAAEAAARCASDWFRDAAQEELVQRAEALGRPLVSTHPAVAARLELLRAQRAQHSSDPAGYLEHVTRIVEICEASGDRRTACGARQACGWAPCARMHAARASRRAR